MRFAFFLCAIACAQTPADLFSQRCALCHGEDAAGTDRGPGLVKTRLSLSQIEDVIHHGTSGGMPAFALPEKDLEGLASLIRSMNVTAFDAPLVGDVAAGERFFFGEGKCGECHRAMGRGKSVGPDLSSIARQRTVAELQRPAPRADLVTVRLRDGRRVEGLARKETLHSLELQTIDGKLLLLAEGEYEVAAREKYRHVVLSAVSDDLLAFLSRMGGVGVGALTAPVEPEDSKAIEQVLHPARGEWPTYNGNVSGNRHSALDQINKHNVARLAMRWSFTIPYFGLEATPLVSEGVMYISGPNQVYALDARSGEEIWKYVRPRTTHPLVPGDAKGGANRGVALLGDRVFMTTDDAHLICVDRLTGCEVPGARAQAAAACGSEWLFYVLDRTNGELLLAKAFVKKLTWATGIDAKGRPIEVPGNIPTPEGTATCPDIRGAANWMSTAYNPSTGLYYAIAIENCGVYRSTQFGGGKGEAADGPRRFDRGGNFFSVPGAEPPKRYLRAIDIQTGKTAWEVEQRVPDPNYGGVLSTAGGLVFYSELSGGFAAVDAGSGKTFWHFETGQPPKASPMTYVVNGRQYVAIASGANVLAFALP